VVGKVGIRFAFSVPRVLRPDAWIRTGRSDCSPQLATIGKYGASDGPGHNRLFAHTPGRGSGAGCLPAAQCTPFRPAPDPWIDALQDLCYDTEQLLVLGSKAVTGAEIETALKFYRRAMELDPKNPKVYNNLGVCLLEQERFQQAVVYLNKALQIDPEHIEARYNLAMSLWGLGKTEEGIGQYYHVLQLKPKWAKAANSLAWILATDRNADIRNGGEAVEWAMVACKGEGRKNPEYLDFLASAYAEAGRFTKALEIAQKSLMMAKTIGNTELFYEARHRLQLYKRGKAFHR
jgi:tetratricopeptide (TPR) repeat protein